jgi:hypothetical protein
MKPSMLIEEEVLALCRFWRRRAFWSFEPAGAVAGETDYLIRTDQLIYSLARIRELEALLAKDRLTLEVKP